MIRSKTVHGRDGKAWLIRRRWAPRPKWRGPIGKRLLELLDVGLDAIDLEGILFFIGIVIFIVFMVFVGAPLLVFLFETLLIIPIAIVAGVVGRVLFRRPWTIEASANPPADWPNRIAWNVVGWRASSRAAERMASLLRATGSAPPTPPPDFAGDRTRRRALR